MARHTIGSRRGSVRGAPPGVYIGFGTYTNQNDIEPWAQAFRLCKQFLCFGLGILILSFIGVCLWAIGLLPDWLRQ